jgi:hypothetical protein
LIVDKTFYGDFSPLLKDYALLMAQLIDVLNQKVSKYPTQLWTSPLMHALYIFACVKVPSDRNDQILKDSANFPLPYLWLLWSCSWVSTDGFVQSNVHDLYQLMFQAITDPRSNYRPRDAIMSVEHFVASSGIIEENDLRAFFYAMGAGRDLTVADDDAPLLFLTSLGLKLCQQSNLSTFKIFHLLMDRLWKEVLDVEGNQGPCLFCILLPLLRDCLGKRSRLRDNTMVTVPDTSLVPAPSSEMVQLVVMTQVVFSHRTLLELEEDVVKHAMIMVLSLVAHEGRSLANQIVGRWDVDVWRGAFEYFDLHRESDILFYSF